MKVRIQNLWEISNLAFQKFPKFSELVKHLLYKTGCMQIRAIPNHPLSQDTPILSPGATCYPPTMAQTQPQHLFANQPQEESGFFFTTTKPRRLGIVLCHLFISIERTPILSLNTAAAREVSVGQWQTM